MINSEMKMQNIINALFELEKHYDMFNKEIEGVYFWKRCRLHVYLNITNKHLQFNDCHTQSSRNRLFSGLSLVARSLLDYPFWRKNSDILVMASGRRFFNPLDKKYQDIYTDTIIKHLSSVVVFQAPSLTNTTRLPKPHQVKYLDYISLCSVIAQRIISKRFKASDLQYLKKLDAKFENVFNIKCDIVDKAKKAVYKAKIQIPMFRHLVRRISPKIALIVGSYGQENFIEACHEEGVSVIELQHGPITPYSVNYTMPPCKNIQKLFPDYLMVFGQLWKDINQFPVPKENIIVTGFPFFELEKKRLKVNNEKKKEIVFISQPTIGDRLSRIAMKTADLLGNKWSVIYRLHPSEFGNWEHNYSWFIGSKVKVETGEKPLYELLNESQWHVGVYSVAIIEGLSLGSRAILIDLPGFEHMSFLIENKYALVADSAEAVAAIIQSNYHEIEAANIDYLFEPNAERNVLNAIQQLLCGHP